MMTNVMVRACLNKKMRKIWIWFRQNIKKTLAQDRNLTECRIYPKAEFHWMPNVPRFRSVDWTQDIIIVKWHLLIWHARKLCALTNRPPAQSTRTGQWLSTSFHANCFIAQFYVLHPWQFIFALSSRSRSILQVFLFSERQEGYFKKIFVHGMIRNVMVSTCLNKEIIKISNLIQAKNTKKSLPDTEI